MVYNVRFRYHGRISFELAVEAITVRTCMVVLGGHVTPRSDDGSDLSQGGPKVNGRLVMVINNIADQLRPSQIAFNATNPTEQT